VDRRWSASADLAGEQAALLSRHAVLGICSGAWRKGGSTNINTSTLLFGLPAIMGAVAYLKGIYDVRKARTTDVRHHFIGCNPKGKDGKKLVMRQCRAMGWTVEDDNEADALATIAGAPAS
jgi:hypothetical protein